MFDPGDRANQYVIESALGKGGQGVVFKATDTSLSRPVVLKFLLGEWTTSATAVERFRREAQSASQLNHPNVCTIYEINTTERDVLFISMAYYRGETLAARIQREPLPWHEVVDLGIGIAGGLQAAHTASLVHRDIKPSNIILTGHGPIILDFGIAKVLEPQDGETPHQTLTRTGWSLGTPNYMAPEQFRGTSVDRRTDIFSLGVMLFEMLTGHRPFHGDSAADIASAVLRDQPESAHDLNGQIPLEVSAAIDVCLIKEPELRWQDAGQLSDALKRIQSAVPRADASTSPQPTVPPTISVPLRSQTTHPPTPYSQTPYPPTPPQQPAPSGRRAGWLLGAIVGAVSAVVIGAVIWFVAIRDRTPPVLQVESTMPAGDVLPIRGQTEPGATVEVNGTRFEVGPDGRFEGSLPMIGEAIDVEVVARDAAGNEERLQQRVIGSGSDTTPPAPEIEESPAESAIDRPIEDTTPPTLEIAELDPGSDVLPVRGRTEPGATVRVNGAVVEVDARGGFEVTVARKGDVFPVSVVARDAAGNETPWSRRVPARTKGPASDVTPPDVTTPKLEVADLVPEGDKRVPQPVKVDTVPPEVALDELSPQAGVLPVTGRTELGATVIINGERVELDAAGRFVTSVTPTGEVFELELVARDAAGNETPLSRRIPFVLTFPEGVTRDGELLFRDRDGMQMIRIPAGEFRMGYEAGAGDEKPVHVVQITRDFLIDRHEVTLGQYRSVLGKAPQPVGRFLLSTEERKRPSTERPMAEMNWEDATRYCDAVGGRLPTEAEWEYAARGGIEDSAYPWGSETGCQTGACANVRGRRDGFDKPAPVCSFEPNGYGLCDTAGNLWEWVSDWYGKTYYAASSAEDPQGPSSGTKRCLRGGSYGHDLANARVADRFAYSVLSKHATFGIRCVVEF